MVIQSYLSKKGYVIRKETLSKEELELLKSVLVANPLVNDNTFNIKTEKFPVYIETKNKIYIPKMYGIEKFGINKQLDDYTGKLIDKSKLECKCVLYDNQKEPVNLLMESLYNTGGGILSMNTGGGKCLRRDTPILMFDGTIKMVQDIVVGDIIMGDDSTPRNVLSLGNGQDEMYDIIPVKGEKYTVNKEHILCLKITGNPTIYRNKKYNTWQIKWFDNNKYITKSFKIDKKQEALKFLNNIKQQDIMEIPVKDYIKLSKDIKYILKGYKVSIDFPEKILNIDPYMIGFWLGDGSASTSEITIQDSSIIKYFKENLIKINCHLQYSKDSDYIINGLFLIELQNQNLLNNKHIPVIYKCNSRENRLKLLAGLIDSGGYYNKQNMYVFWQGLNHENLIDDIIYLSRSLGFACYKKKKKPTWAYKGYAWRICISGEGIEEIPILCLRKKCNPRKQIKNALMTDILVKHVGRDNYYGFTLDNNNRFVLGDFTVTHNTASSIYVISKLGGKTIIVVNKIPLMYQWVDEIKKFLPNVKVGILQGQKNINIENCDIVVAMLQSLSRIDYPDIMFDEFNTTILDECFTYDTSIMTSKGDIYIGDLYKMKMQNKELPTVYTFNETTECFEYKKIINVFRKTNKNLLKIEINKKTIIKSTRNHRYFTATGWKEAKNINIGDFIYSSQREYEYVSNINTIENSDVNNYVYDLEILDNHNYFVTDNILKGFLVHNCHNLGSKVFSSIMFKLSSKYTIGLSATPNRADGCEYIFKWHIGDIVYKSKEAVRDGLNPIIQFIKMDSEEYKEEYSINKWTGLKTLQFTTMLSYLVKMENRNKLILDIIKNTLKADSGRKILVLSDRRAHLESLVKTLDKSSNIDFTYGLCLGAMKKSQFDISKSSQCIFATFAAFSEGVSEKDLDTLFLISPKKYIDNEKQQFIKNSTNSKKDSGKLNQIIGRIFRKNHIQRNPLIIDLFDNFSVYKKHFNTRKEFYKKNLKNAVYENYSVNLDDPNSILKKTDTKKQSSSKTLTDYCFLD